MQDAGVPLIQASRIKAERKRHMAREDERLYRLPSWKHTIEILPAEVPDSAGEHEPRIQLQHQGPNSMAARSGQQPFEPSPKGRSSRQMA